MRISKCRCPGITQQGKSGIEYTKHFIAVVKQRKYGRILFRDAAETFNISRSCYENREKDCQVHMSCLYGKEMKERMKNMRIH